MRSAGEAGGGTVSEEKETYCDFIFLSLSLPESLSHTLSFTLSFSFAFCAFSFPLSFSSLSFFFYFLV